MQETRSGFAAIIGKPNVGKSTLLNALIGKKISITSPKVQTTRHNILGVKTVDNAQIIYCDTPGMHIGEKRRLNKYMNKAARSSLSDVDVVLFLLSGMQLDSDDEKVIDLLQRLEQPIVLVINKIDLIKDKQKLLPFIQELSKRVNFSEVLPISVIKKDNLDKLEQIVAKYLKVGPFYFAADAITDKDESFRVSEIIREGIMYRLGEELPYSTTVTVESIKKEERIVKIYATILVERDSQKAIVIGQNGNMLKDIGVKARESIQINLDFKKVFLDLRVKVKNSWADDVKALPGLGYEN